MKKKIGLTVLALFIIVLAGVCGYGYHYYTKYVNIATIYPGVKIAGIDVSGMTKEEAQKTVDDYVNTVSEQKVTLQVGKKEKSFLLSDMGLYCTKEDPAKEAWELGRNDGIFKRVVEIRRLEKEGQDLPLSFGVDADKSQKVFKKTAKKFLAKKKDAVIKREDGKFKITPEVNGIDIDFAENADKLIEYIQKEDWDQKEVVFPVDYKTDKAKHTKKELSVIKDVMGTFTTSYYDSPYGRCLNVENGASLINGTLLYPGEEFSVYEAVAPFNSDNGYHLAGSYENGKTVQTYGGGICQVSTTLYNAVLRAELEVTERQPHSMTVHYVKLSEDAAISGTEKDLKFKNNLDYPIYIEGKAGDASITFTIYGKEYRDENRSIEFISETTSVRPPGEKIIKDKTMEEGKKKVEENGRTGYSARLWKVIRVDGEEVDRVQINSSSYQSVKKVVRVGTKKKEDKKEAEEKKKEQADKQKQAQEKQTEKTEQKE